MKAQDMAFYPKQYDLIVAGAGHAGAEAALAAARMGCSVCVFAVNLETLAAMPCSPSIGGTGKGQLVREVDALGGAMAKISDLTAIQYRTLNTRKGPAVQSTRTQNDKNRYHLAMKQVMERDARIDLKQAIIERLLIEDGRITGVVDHTGYAWGARAVVLATGTFLSGLIHIGHTSMPAGRAGEFPAYALAEQMKALGFAMGRMKTGTPARLHRASIDFSVMEEERPDPAPRPFSLGGTVSPLPQLSSHTAHTSAKTRQIIRENLGLSALYGGRITGAPARYCPSLEDKVVRFADKERHQVILEPEGIDSEEIYASGLGNSMPMEVQVALVRSVPGLEQAEIMRPAYAIEYDYLNPLELLPTLMTKRVEGLFTAGQINGTSGYEEAAAQGLWAGVNAACLVQKRPPFILTRAEGYMGVMVDDLVTKGVTEPYRMFTSRAEYRLLLREDNADLRLMEKGREYGLVDPDLYKAMAERKREIADELARVNKTIVKPGPETAAWLQERGAAPLEEAAPLSRVLKRAGVDYGFARRFAPAPGEISPEAERQVEIEVKYEGYIARQLKEVEKAGEMERIKIPPGFDYGTVPGLSNELKAKFARIRPVNLGQAGRVEGASLAALYAVLTALRAGGGVGKDEG
jgi:tRNA uridine 5-carboxymethylaminomethyl modification enzyme